MSDLPPLIELVHRYQQAADLDERETLAQAMVRRMDPELRLFLLGRCEERFVEDLLQEVDAAMFRKLDVFKGESDDQLWAWVRLIARRKVIDHYRAEARNPAAPNATEPLEAILADANEDLQVKPPQSSRLADSLLRLRQIDPLCFEYLWSRYVVGLSLAEMAAAHGIAYDTMRMRVKRCGEKGRQMAIKHSES